jgi:hypothetical protein
MEPDGVLFLEPSTEKVLPDGVLYLSDGRQYVSADSHQTPPSPPQSGSRILTSSADILSDAFSNSYSPEESAASIGLSQSQVPLPPQQSLSNPEPATRFVDLYSSETDGGIYDALSNYMLTASPYIQDSLSSTALRSSSSLFSSTKTHPDTLSNVNIPTVSNSGYNSTLYPSYCSFPYFPLFPQLPLLPTLSPQFPNSQQQQQQQSIPSSISLDNIFINNSKSQKEIPISTHQQQQYQHLLLKRTNEVTPPSLSNHPSEFASKEDYFKSALREQQLQRYRMKKMRRVYTRPVDEKRSLQAKNRERNSRGRFVNNNK